MAQERFVTIDLTPGLIAFPLVAGQAIFSWFIFALSAGAVITIKNGNDGDQIPLETGLQWKAPDQCNGESPVFLTCAPQPGASLMIYYSLAPGGSLGIAP
jgi:hypothetical protein